MVLSDRICFDVELARCDRDQGFNDLCKRAEVSLVLAAALLNVAAAAAAAATCRTNRRGV